MMKEKFWMRRNFCEKKSLIALMAFGVLSSVSAQPIVSVGDLKIGMTEDQFLELPDIKSKNIQDFSNKKENSTYWVDVWKKTRESQNLIYSSRIYTPEYVKYDFQMSTGVKDFTNADTYIVTAEFYKKELIEIKLNIPGSAPQYIEILTAKYGKPIVANGIKNEFCQDAYGLISNQKTGGITWNWRGKGPIEAIVSMSRFDCGMNWRSSYKVVNSKKSKLVFDLESQAEKNEKNEEAAKVPSSKL